MAAGDPSRPTPPAIHDICNLPSGEQELAVVGGAIVDSLCEGSFRRDASSMSSPPSAHSSLRHAWRDEPAACPASPEHDELRERIAACERTQADVVAALRALHEALHARSDELQDDLLSLRLAVEPQLLAVAGVDGTTVERQRRYGEAVGRIRGIVRRLLPGDARVLVVSRGDDDLLRLSGRPAGHFPQDAAGDYSGHHPGDDASAVAHLHDLAAAGWQYLVIPESAFWWLDHYVGLRAHLERCCTAVHGDADTCAIWAIDRPGPWLAAAGYVAEFRDRMGRYPAILDLDTGRDLAAVFPECAVFGPPDPGLDSLPYIDESIDVVAVADADAARLPEARRVAADAVMGIATTPGPGGPIDGVVIDRPRGGRLGDAARLPRE